MEEVVSQPDDSDDDSDLEEGRFGPRGRRLLRILGLVLITIAVLLAVYGSVVYVALQRGQTLREDSEKEALQQELDDQIVLAQENIESGNYELALRRLAWILERDPAYPRALELQRQAEEGLNARNVPTSVPTQPPPTPEPVPEGADPAVIFSDLEQLIEDEDWQSAVKAIADFQAEFPDYRRRESDAMLYDAYINAGLALVQGDQVELGLFYLTQAERLGDLPVEIEDWRTWAELYLAGIGYYGVDWEAATFYFRGLCAAAPYYQDSCGWLYDALIAYGDQYAAALDWCPAQGLYREATSYDTSRVAADKLQEARALCLEATPTPKAVITATLTLTTTTPSAPN